MALVKKNKTGGPIVAEQNIRIGDNRINASNKDLMESYANVLKNSDASSEEKAVLAAIFNEYIKTGQGAFDVNTDNDGNIVNTEFVGRSDFSNKGYGDSKDFSHMLAQAAIGVRDKKPVKESITKDNNVAEPKTADNSTTAKTTQSTRPDDNNTEPNADGKWETTKGSLVDANAEPYQKKTFDGQTVDIPVSKDKKEKLTKPGERKNLEQLANEGFSTEDYADLASFALDVGSLASSAFSPLSAGLGVGASVSSAVADYNRGDSGWDIAKNLGTNLALDAATAIPGAGIAAKIGKIAKNAGTAAKVGKWMLKNAATMGALYGKTASITGATEAATKLINGDFSSLTIEDLNSITQSMKGMKAISSGRDVGRGLKNENYIDVKGKRVAVPDDIKTRKEAVDYVSKNKEKLNVSDDDIKGVTTTEKVRSMNPMKKFKKYDKDLDVQNDVVVKTEAELSKEARNSMLGGITWTPSGARKAATKYIDSKYPSPKLPQPVKKAVEKTKKATTEAIDNIVDSKNAFVKYRTAPKAVQERMKAIKKQQMGSDKIIDNKMDYKQWKTPDIISPNISLQQSIDKTKINMPTKFIGKLHKPSFDERLNLATKGITVPEQTEAKVGNVVGSEFGRAMYNTIRNLKVDTRYDAPILQQQSLAAAPITGNVGMRQAAYNRANSLSSAKPVSSDAMQNELINRSRLSQANDMRDQADAQYSAMLDQSRAQNANQDMQIAAQRNAIANQNIQNIAQASNVQRQLKNQKMIDTTGNLDKFWAWKNQKATQSELANKTVNMALKQQESLDKYKDKELYLLNEINSLDAEKARGLMSQEEYVRRLSKIKEKEALINSAKQREMMNAKVQSFKNGGQFVAYNNYAKAANRRNEKEISKNSNALVNLRKIIKNIK